MESSSPEGGSVGGSPGGGVAGCVPIGVEPRGVSTSGLIAVVKRMSQSNDFLLILLTLLLEDDP